MLLSLSPFPQDGIIAQIGFLGKIWLALVLYFNLKRYTIYIPMYINWQDGISLNQNVKSEDYKDLPMLYLQKTFNNYYGCH